VPRTVVCRHCGEGFDPLPRKPGYLDECPRCLYDLAEERRKPLPPEAVTLRPVQQTVKHPWEEIPLDGKIVMWCSLAVKVAFILFAVGFLIYLVLRTVSGMF
jgi:hypothetical protein